MEYYSEMVTSGAGPAVTTNKGCGNIGFTEMQCGAFLK